MPIEPFVLDNGMTFLLVPRPEMTTVAAGWVAHVGSVDEQPGRTGLTHFLEHLLFKGTATIGSRNWQEERNALAELEDLQETLADLDSGAGATTRRDLELRVAAANARHRELVVPGAFQRAYGEAGATGLNALTFKDLTLYYVTVPANKLELWFWMESDRLLAPVFRGLESEREVIREERRQRVASSPTGHLEEALQRRVWGAHPYAWPVLGRPDDLATLRRADAERHFATYYRAANLTAVLVGRFEPATVRTLARRYFGRLDRGNAPPTLTAHPAPPKAEPRLQGQRLEGQRLEGQCDCRPQVIAHYPTVPFRHPDTAALEVVAGLLNGRTGRLYRELVLGQRLAFAAQASHNAMKHAGLFTFGAEAQGEVTPQALLAAWDTEVARLHAELVPTAELRKVKNQITADSYRRLREPAALMLQLLVYDALGDWRHIDEQAVRALAVSAEAVRETARRYLQPAHRTVGLYQRQDAAQQSEATTP